MGDRAAVQELQAPTVPPQNLDAEESVLGAMMLLAGAIAAVSEILSTTGASFTARATPDLPGGARPVRQGRAGRRHHPRRRDRRARGARGRRWQGAHPRAGRPRPAAANSGHYARIVHESARSAGSSTRAARSPASAGIARATRPSSSTAPSRSSSTCRKSVPRASSPTSRSSSRKASSASRRCTSRAPTSRVFLRLSRSRPHHVGIPGRNRDRRGAPQHGEVGPRALRRGEPRRARVDARRALHARDVEVRGHAAAHDAARRRSSRSASAPASSRPRTGRG